MHTHTHTHTHTALLAWRWPPEDGFPLVLCANIRSVTTFRVCFLCGGKHTRSSFPPALTHTHTHTHTEHQLSICARTTTHHPSSRVVTVGQAPDLILRGSVWLHYIVITPDFILMWITGGPLHRAWLALSSDYSVPENCGRYKPNRSLTDSSSANIGKHPIADATKPCGIYQVFH